HVVLVQRHLSSLLPIFSVSVPVSTFGFSSEGGGSFAGSGFFTTHFTGFPSILVPATAMSVRSVHDSPSLCSKRTHTRSISPSEVISRYLTVVPGPQPFHESKATAMGSPAACIDG